MNKSFIEGDIIDKTTKDIPIISLLKTLPDFIKKRYKKSDVEIPYGNSDIENLSFWLKDNTSEELINILTDIYKECFDKKNVKMINKIKKYHKFTDKDEFLESIEKDNYKISPTDLSVLQSKLNINFKLLTNQYKDKYEEYDISDKNEEKDILILYHYNDNDKYVLGVVKINDKYLNKSRELI